MNQYEAMFLFDPTFAADFSKAKEEIERILQRAEAEIVFLEKWDERKLAYEIKGRKRGCYVLVYFNGPSEKIVGIERDASLSESVLRVLVKRADSISRETMERTLPSKRSAEDEAEVPSDSPAGDNKEKPEAKPEEKPKPQEAANEEDAGESPDVEEDDNGKDENSD